ncbi:TonB-dependent receptor [Helicobacter saguini]|uniref:TonB-dependent receptor n=1 Tax=Helicobacter saguini TaxID=1548018 RepID=A0A347VSR0_9HELI|nr:TonB-dependent receptor [Helicobacter saguini]MWV62400.1 TonB-dependent receptor [Helicobacter saguini]MWV66928.1 TonB-dependent receptor [Helicobacter saguini]MWV71168.1 TonB-dependent receptor [Helicobacter saguini]TLD94944.1 TonB-dependent receptor [Helicobacter saguini]
MRILLFCAVFFAVLFADSIESKEDSINDITHHAITHSAITHPPTPPNVNIKQGGGLSSHKSIDKQDSIKIALNENIESKQTKVDVSPAAQHDEMKNVQNNGIKNVQNEKIKIALNENIESRKKDSIKLALNERNIESSKEDSINDITHPPTPLRKGGGLSSHKSIDKQDSIKLALSENTESNLSPTHRHINKKDSIKIALNESNTESNLSPTHHPTNKKDSIKLAASNVANTTNASKTTSDDDDDEIIFDEINVSAAKIKDEEKPFTKPGAVSTRTGVADSTQSLDQIIRGIPGTFTQVDQSQGTISVNIRNMTGLGRVNTEIDGVTQTFFGSSEDSGRYHTGGKLMGTSAFGAAIDQNLIVGVDVERGSFSGSRSNALMGSANLRTIGVDDILRDSKYFGVIAKFGYGDNKVGPNYMAGVATKYRFSDNFVIGAMYAYSGRKTEQGYRTGGGFQTRPNTQTMVIENLTQQPNNHLAKIETKFFKYHQAILSFRHYDNHLAGRKIRQDTIQTNYKFKPNSNLIDFNVMGAYSNSAQIYDENAEVMGGAIGKMNGKAYNNAMQIEAYNIFSFPLSTNTNISTRLGYKYFYNNYNRDFDISVVCGDTSPDTCYDDGTMLTSMMYGFQPKGTQHIHTIYLDSNYNYKIINLNANLSYILWNLNTTREAPCSGTNKYCNPKEAGYFSRSGSNFNTSLMLSFNFHGLFTPFVSYALTSRIPNVQEMFFGSHSATAQNFNTSLKPEIAQTYQAGFSSFKQGLFFSDDSFGFKSTAFYTDIQDYIYGRTIGGSNASGSPTGRNDLLYLSFNGFAKMYGLESELHYDMGYFYIRASYTLQRANLIVSESDANYGGSGTSNLQQHTGQSQFAELPEDYGNFDLGIRLWKKKIVVGTLIKYIGRTKRINPYTPFTTPSPDNAYLQVSTQYLPRIPVIYDMYINFFLHKNLDLRLEIQNLMDTNYMDALYTYNSNSGAIGSGGLTLFNNSARGRTYIASVTIRY